MCPSSESLRLMYDPERELVMYEEQREQERDSIELQDMSIRRN